MEVSLFELQWTQLADYPVPFPLCRMNYHLVQRGNELGPNDGLLISPYPTFPGSLEVRLGLLSGREDVGKALIQGFPKSDPNIYFLNFLVTLRHSCM